MKFLESWDLDHEEPELPVVKRVKKKTPVIIPPTLALYRSVYEKNLCEELTEDMAATNRIHASSHYFGFKRGVDPAKTLTGTQSMLRSAPTLPSIGAVENRGTAGPQGDTGEKGA